MPASQLQKDLKKRNPFESPQAEAMLGVLRTADQFSNRLGRLFRNYDLTSGQYNVLRILRGEGAPLPSLEIASRMIQVVPAITRLIDGLESRELVTRRRCDSDRRVVYVELTKQGLALTRRIDEPLDALHQQLMAHLNATELKELSRLLERARLSVREDAS